MNKNLKNRHAEVMGRGTISIFRINDIKSDLNRLSTRLHDIYQINIYLCIIPVRYFDLDNGKLTFQSYF